MTHCHGQCRAIAPSAHARGLLEMSPISPDCRSRLSPVLELISVDSIADGRHCLLNCGTNPVLSVDPWFLFYPVFKRSAMLASTPLILLNVSLGSKPSSNLGRMSLLDIPISSPTPI